MDRLIVFADYVCPYCYLAETQLERLRRAVPLEIEPAAFELRPPGTALPAPDAEWMRRGWRESVEPLARSLGVEMRYPRMSTRTRKAHEAVAHARQHGAALAMHSAIYRAWWRAGRDIGRIDVLMELAVEAGLDGTALKVELDIDKWTDRVVQEEETASQYGIAGVPAYVAMAGSDVTGIRTGLQHYDELKDWMTDRS